MADNRGSTWRLKETKCTLSENRDRFYIDFIAKAAVNMKRGTPVVRGTRARDNEDRNWTEEGHQG